MKRNSRALAAGSHLIRRVLGWLLIWFVVVILALWAQVSIGAVLLAMATIGILFSLFTLYFFRDPSPQVPSDPTAILAPAHGRVDCVDKTSELEFVGGSCRRISIFLSVFDVHVQNAPLAGKIVFLRHQAGQFLNAIKTESARTNENVLIGIQSLERPGERIAVRQIAGLIARRIVPWVRVGDSVVRGQRLGLIQFGSRCDIYLPLAAQIIVLPGDRVVAGETIVATRPLAKAGHANLLSSAGSKPSL
jgi:phosphatidylserine decarboxylase